MADVRRVRNGTQPKRCWYTIDRFDSLRGSYSLQQFLCAISQSLGAHTTAFDVVLDASDAEDDDQQQQQPTQQD